MHALSLLILQVAFMNDFCFVSFFEMGSLCVAQAGLELGILLPLPPQVLGLQMCATTPSPLTASVIPILRWRI
jgi:hypothetical protein